MELKYNIPKYIAQTKMSAKKRVLVEGKDDKAHFKNLLDMVAHGHKVRIDTAENIKGDCTKTNKNNRAKIDKIHAQCNALSSHRNLHYLCDREYYKFEIEEQIADFMVAHESTGNLTWTLGHSIENYFFTTEILCDAYRYLCGSEYKSSAISVFSGSLNSGLKIISAITLAARDMGMSGFPAGHIFWNHLTIENQSVYFDVGVWANESKSDAAQDFEKAYKSYLSIVEQSDTLICSRICRGHTAMLLLQRLFASCIYLVTTLHNEEMAYKDANNFSKIKEVNVANALCESWVRFAKVGKASYPSILIERVA